MNKYDGEVDDEFDYEIKEYRRKKARRKQKMEQRKTMDNFDQMENLLKRKNFADGEPFNNNGEQDFSKFSYLRSPVALNLSVLDSSECFLRRKF